MGRRPHSGDRAPPPRVTPHRPRSTPPAAPDDSCRGTQAPVITVITPRRGPPVITGHPCHDPHAATARPRHDTHAARRPSRPRAYTASGHPARLARPADGPARRHALRGRSGREPADRPRPAADRITVSRRGGRRLAGGARFLVRGAPRRPVRSSFRCPGILARRCRPLPARARCPGLRPLKSHVSPCGPLSPSGRCRPPAPCAPFPLFSSRGRSVCPRTPRRSGVLVPPQALTPLTGPPGAPLSLSLLQGAAPYRVRRPCLATSRVLPGALWRAFASVVPRDSGPQRRPEIGVVDGRIEVVLVDGREGGGLGQVALVRGACSYSPPLSRG